MIRKKFTLDGVMEEGYMKDNIVSDKNKCTNKTYCGNKSYNLLPRVRGF